MEDQAELFNQEIPAAIPMQVNEVPEEVLPAIEKQLEKIMAKIADLETIRDDPINAWKLELKCPANGCKYDRCSRVGCPEVCCTLDMCNDEDCSHKPGTSCGRTLCVKVDCIHKGCMRDRCASCLVTPHPQRCGAPLSEADYVHVNNIGGGPIVRSLVMRCEHCRTNTTPHLKMVYINRLCVEKNHVCHSSELPGTKNTNKLDMGCLECGRRWFPRLDVFKKGANCSCKNSDVTLIERINRIIECIKNHQGFCMGEFSRVKKDLMWKCKFPNHPWWFACYQSVVDNGTWCSKSECAYSYEDKFTNLCAKLETRGLQCNSNKYDGSDEKVSITCNYGHTFEARPTALLNSRGTGSGCLKCLHEDVDGSKLAKCKAFALLMLGTCLSLIYINDATLMEWMCEHGHKWLATWNHVGRRIGASWCGTCSSSKSEAQCRAYLRSLLSTDDITYLFMKVRRDMCVDGIIRNLELDCYSKIYLSNGETIKIALEFDGGQHRYVDGHMIKTQEDLLDLQSRDQMKSKWCIQKNIHLIRVPDTIPLKDRFTFVKNALIDLGLTVNIINNRQLVEINASATKASQSYEKITNFIHNLKPGYTVDRTRYFSQETLEQIWMNCPNQEHPSMKISKRSFEKGVDCIGCCLEKQNCALTNIKNEFDEDTKHNHRIIEWQCYSCYEFGEHRLVGLRPILWSNSPCKCCRA